MVESGWIYLAKDPLPLLLGIVGVKVRIFRAQTHDTKGADFGDRALDV